MTTIILSFFLAGNRWAIGTCILSIVVILINWKMYSGNGLVLPPIWTISDWNLNLVMDQTISIIFSSVMIYVNNLTLMRSQREILDFQEKELSNQQILFQNSRMAELGEVAGGIAHEINNPLTIIQVHSQLMNKQLRKLKDNEQLRSLQEDLQQFDKHINKIDQTCNRISKIISGLKTYSRNGENDPMENFGVSDLLDEVFELFREKFEFRTIQFKCHSGAPARIEIKGRKAQVYQVIVNLLNNAVDALENQLNPWIAIKVVPEGDLISIMVIDSGPGIPDKIKEKVLMPFFTTKAPGKGTGLGLSIVKKIMKQHEGDLILTQEAGHNCIKLSFKN